MIMRYSRKRAFILLPLALATFAFLRSTILVGQATSSFRGTSNQWETPTDKAVRAALAGKEADILWERGLTPKVVWLASYPNSGTSYTITLVERASNLSTASNYGVEVTYKREDSLPIYQNHPEGPFWEGTSGEMGTIRELPTTSVLTKTHCGGRCVKCGADEYVIDKVNFLAACQRTTHRLKGKSLESLLPASTVAGMVHLIRNPYHNTVARFHLERRNMVEKKSDVAAKYPSNSTGFARWCDHLDSKYSASDKRVLPASVLELMKDVPCRAEFFKWTQWHNLALESSRQLGFPEARPVPVLTVLYEDYADNFNRTFEGIMNFLELPIAAKQLRTFRDLPTYADHFTAKQRQAVKALIQHVASEETWALIEHYFEDDATTAFL